MTKMRCSVGAVVSITLLLCGPRSSLAQQITGVPGAPSATTSPSESLPEVC